MLFRYLSSRVERGAKALAEGGGEGKRRGDVMDTEIV